jgi:hypothetical protein
MLSLSRFDSPGHRSILGAAGGAFVGVVDENPIFSSSSDSIRKNEAHFERPGGFRLGLRDVGWRLNGFNSKSPVAAKDPVCSTPNGSLNAIGKIPKHRSVSHLIVSEDLRGSLGKTNKAIPGSLKLRGGTGGRPN